MLNHTSQDLPEEDAVEALRAVLAGEESWLVVFDNATDANALVPFMPTGNGRVVVTTRNRTWTANLDMLFEVPTLDQGTVEAWLADAIPGSDPADNSGIAERLDGLPLAVVQAIAYINARPGETCGSYLAKLANPSGLRDVLAQRVPVGYPHPVLTTWEIAVSTLSIDCPAAVTLLGLLAFIDPTGIDLALLDGLVEDLPGALEALLRFSLVTFDDPTVSIHRLVQEVTRLSLSPQQQQDQITTWASHLHGLAPSDDDHVLFGLFNQLTPHVLSLTGHALTEQVYPPDLAQLATDTGWMLMRQASYPAAIALQQQALTIAEHANGPDSPLAIGILGNLATAHAEAGDPATALPLFERVLTIEEAAYLPDHPKVAATLNNLATVHVEAGGPATALPLLERVLAIEEAAYGPDHPQVAVTLNNLANTHLRLRDPATALPLVERALTINEATYGPDHPQVAVTLNNLASTHQELGDPATALPLHQRALTINEATYGPDHPQVAATLNNLANTHAGLRDPATALPLHQRALTINEATYGPDHPRVAVTLNNLANTHNNGLGDPATALPLLERALAINEATYGPDHPITETTRSSLRRLTQDGDT
jgi:tetratricopeptide (TPR) repeat protein